MNGFIILVSTGTQRSGLGKTTNILECSKELLIIVNLGLCAIYVRVCKVRVFSVITRTAKKLSM